jgi:hypothetical protein
MLVALLGELLEEVTPVPSRGGAPSGDSPPEAPEDPDVLKTRFENEGLNLGPRVPFFEGRGESIELVGPERSKRTIDIPSEGKVTETGPKSRDVREHFRGTHVGQIEANREKPREIPERTEGHACRQLPSKSHK